MVNTTLRSLPGPGDLACSYLDREEANAARQLREATDADCIHNGICPECRSEDGCDACGDTGRVEACDGCGKVAAEGSLARVADIIDQPDGTKSIFCGECMVDA
jgi:RecJ-like exonuclease